MSAAVQLESYLNIKQLYASKEKVKLLDIEF